LSKKVYYNGDNQWLRSFDYFHEDEMGYVGVFIDTDENGKKVPRLVTLDGQMSREVQNHHSEEDANGQQ